jgi:hypothetical protein
VKTEKSFSQLPAAALRGVHPVISQGMRKDTGFPVSVNRTSQDSEKSIPETQNHPAEQYLLAGRSRIANTDTRRA